MASSQDSVIFVIQLLKSLARNHPSLCSPRHLLASGEVEVDGQGQANEDDEKHAREEGPSLLKYLFISFGDTSHGPISRENLN